MSSKPKHETEEQAAMRRVAKRAQVEHAFTYHPPKPGQPERYAEITRRFRELALWLLEVTPESWEQGLALTHLEDARMRANAAIAINE